MDRRLTKGPEQPRTVRPRKPTSNADRPIVVVMDEAYTTEEGETGTTDELVKRLRRMPLHTVITACESAKFLRRVQVEYGKGPHFQFRVMPVEREIFTGKQHGRRLTLSLTSVSFFGWSKEKTGRGNSVRNRYHLLLDPLTFSGKWLEERTFSAYMTWAQELRTFCLTQGWNLKPTQGSTARQALQDERFYPEPRRKVPRSTNERVRKHLPGNHYQLGVPADPEVSYDADYLDQSRCHHHHAISARLPDSNSTYGFGRFRHPERSTKAYRGSHERVSSFLDGFCGLIYGRIYWPVSRRKQSPFLPRSLREYEPGQPVYFYSEDLPLFEALGVRVTGIIAAWGSKKQDAGLRKYAEWALAELGDTAPAWKKSLLLSPYGALATTARKQTVAYHRSKRGEKRELVTKGGTRLPVSFHSASKVSEPSTNNVLHRALIEAANRTETLLYAHLLESQGYNVLSIYVDALMVERDIDLPPAPLWPPWRLETPLTRLRFLSDNQFVANELQKLPGITGAELRRHVLPGSLGGAGHMGTKDEQRLRLYQAWIEGRLSGLAKAQ